MAVPMASSAAVVTFGGFRRHVASFRVAGKALCDITTCFITCQKPKVVLRGKRDIFRRCVPAFVAAAALWRPPSSFRLTGAAL